jgi:hypothetical protein
MVVRGRLVYAGIAGSEMGDECGDLLLGSTWHKRGSLEFNENLSGYVQAEGRHERVL